MSEEQSSYRQTLKATFLFGGVQVFDIIISIIRTKFVAVLLGPIGMGIAGLLNSTTAFVGSLTNFGLGTSAVRDIASVYGTGNEERIAKVVAVLRRWVWVTGLLGMFLTIIFAPWLSSVTFGNRNYAFAFILISITLLFKQISSGQDVLLQGMRRLKHLAKAGMASSIFSLITTVPLYYFLGLKGIVPAIIITSIVTLIITWFYANKIKIKKIKVTRSEAIMEGKGMLRMGYLISLSGLISVGIAYGLRIFISNIGGVDQVGLYNAGFAILNTYVGLVFTAMGKDYYPRLSSVAHNNELSKQTINQQAEMGVLILAPLVLVFLVFVKFIVIILYSDKFIAVNGMIHWAALGIFFQAASWSISYIFLAKGESRLYFWNEFIAAAYILGINILGYHLWGLTGLGISFLIVYVLYLIQMLLISNVKYGFSFNLGFLKIFLTQILIVVVCFLLVMFFPNPYPYILGSLLIIISVLYSYRELNRRLDLRTIFLKSKGKQ